MTRHDYPTEARAAFNAAMAAGLIDAWDLAEIISEHGKDHYAAIDELAAILNANRHSTPTETLSPIYRACEAYWKKHA
jgi:hypothetical protein